MISRVAISNFKSIRSIEFAPAKINVFIGEPNTGKSNILEALGLFSVPHFRDEDFGLFRIDSYENLFYDNSIAHPIEVKTWNADQQPFWDVTTTYDGQTFLLQLYNHTNKETTQLHSLKNDNGSNAPFKYYKYKDLYQFNDIRYQSLAPPYGENLFTLLRSNKEIKNLLSRKLGNEGYKLAFRFVNKGLEITKISENITDNDVTLNMLPYTGMSETLKRMVFYNAVLETNNNNILLLDEPESYTYPHSSNHYAERIAYDKNNQFFIITHDNMFLGSIYSKAHIGNMKIFAVYKTQYETQIKELTNDEMQDIFDHNMILNVNKYYEE